MKNLEQYRGCLIGGAAGDALGYAVEFPGTDAVVKNMGKVAAKTVNRTMVSLLFPVPLK